MFRFVKSRRNRCYTFQIRLITRKACKETQAEAKPACALCAENLFPTSSQSSSNIYPPPSRLPYPSFRSFHGNADHDGGCVGRNRLPFSRLTWPWGRTRGDCMGVGLTTKPARLSGLAGTNQRSALGLHLERLSCLTGKEPLPLRAIPAVTWSTSRTGGHAVAYLF